MSAFFKQPFFVVAAALCMLPPAFADGEIAGNASPAEKKRTAADRAVVAGWWENDFKWSDKYYTNGLKFAYTSPALFREGNVPGFVEKINTLLPLASPTGATPAEWRFHFSLTQEIYTPKDYLVPSSPPDDRPYAGVLYGAFGLSSETKNRLDVLELSLGVLGPAALGEQVQNEYHGLIGDPKAQGWDTQQHGNDPVVQLAWERRWRMPLSSDDSFGFDLVPHVHLEAGTVKIYATGGAQLRCGWYLPEDFGADFARATAGTLRPARNADYDAQMRWTPDSFYFFADLQAEAWAWNSTLDGSRWHSGRSVDSRPFIGQLALGFVAQWGGLRFMLAEVIRTKDFSTQDNELFVFTSGSISYVF